MDLRKEILRKNSKKQVDKIVNYVGHDAARFSELIKIYLEGPYRVTQRSAWPISCCVEKNPTLINPHLKKILTYLQKPEIHDAVKRNTLRLLQFIEIPKRYHGMVADICFGYLQNKKEAVAIRVYAMSAIADIARHNHELKQELKLIIEDNLPYTSPAFISRAKKVMRTLESLP